METPAGAPLRLLVVPHCLTKGERRKASEAWRKKLKGALDEAFSRTQTLLSKNQCNCAMPVYKTLL
jgi:hypothetical protein